MKIHELKCWPEFFADIIRETKTFELRKNDRGYTVGDVLDLREWSPDSQQYSGRHTKRRIIHMLEHRPGAECAADFGLHEGYAILSIEPLTSQNCGEK